MTEQQLQDIRTGKVWVENDLINPRSSKEERQKLQKVLQSIWPEDYWLPEGKKFYKSDKNQSYWYGEDVNSENLPTIKASILLQELSSSSPVQLYPL